MVVLSITPTRGNNTRFFPHAGFLGLTPVILQGTVRTVLEEDRKPLRASSVCIRIRCYESENVGTSKGRHVIYEQELVLWRKPESEVWGDVGTMEWEFRLVVPIDAGGVSTTTFKHYKAWWQIEGVVNHKASPLHGSRKMVHQIVPLIRFSPPTPAPPPPAASWFSETSRTTRGLRYALSTSSTSLGPEAPIDLSILLERDDPTLQVRKVQLSLDRRVTIDTSKLPPASGSDDDEGPSDGSEFVDEEGLPVRGAVQAHGGRQLSKGFSSVFKRGTSRGASPLPSPNYAPTAEPSSYFSIASPASTGSTMSTCSTRVDSPPTTSSAGTTPPSSASMVRTSSSTVSLITLESVDVPFNKPTQLVGNAPGSKSIFRYSVGESMRTKYASLEFFLTVRIHVRSRTGATEIIELDPRPVFYGATSAKEVQDASVPAGLIVAYADAELRIAKELEKSGEPGLGRIAPSAPPPRAGLGVRRASHFTLTVDTSHAAASTVGPPLPSPTSLATSPGRRNSWFDSRGPSVRRRSEQSDALAYGAPVRSRARVSAAPEPTALPAPTVAPHYIPSRLGGPPLSRIQSPATPPTPDFIFTPTPSTFPDSINPPVRSGFFPLANVPPHLLPPSPTSSTESASGYSARGSSASRTRRVQHGGPYSNKNRPRSAGALSAISQRSNVSSTGSISGRSIASINSNVSSRYAREQSEPLPSTSSSTLLLPSELPALRIIDDVPSPDSSSSPFQHYVSGVIPVPSSPSPSSSDDYSDDEGDLDMRRRVDSPPSPAIDFQSFSLVAPAKTKTVEAGADLDQKMRATIAPWTEVSPFDKTGEDVPQMKRRTPAAPFVGGGTVKSEYLGSVTPGGEGGGRRKSSVGFNLFGKQQEEGKEGGAWGFLRRGSRTA